MSRYRFIAAEKADFPVRVPCTVLGVSASGSTRGARAPVRPRAVGCCAAGADPDDPQGRQGPVRAPLVDASLRDERGVRVSRKRVERLMRLDRLAGRQFSVASRTSRHNSANCSAVSPVVRCERNGSPGRREFFGRKSRFSRGNRCLLRRHAVGQVAELGLMNMPPWYCFTSARAGVAAVEAIMATAAATTVTLLTNRMIVLLVSPRPSRPARRWSPGQAG